MTDPTPEVSPEQIAGDLMSVWTGQDLATETQDLLGRAIRRYGDQRAAEAQERCAQLAAGLYGCDEHCVKHYRPHGRHAPDCRAEVCEDVADAIRDHEE